MQKLPKDKVRAIGVSNFGIKNLEILLNDPTCKVVPAVNREFLFPSPLPSNMKADMPSPLLEIEIHPNNPSPKLIAYNTSKGIHSTGYSCLGSTNSPLYSDDTLLSIAKAKGKTPQQVLLAWGIQQGWSVIPKSVNKERIETNFELDGWELTDEELKKISGLTGRFKVCGDAWLPVKVFFGDDE